MYPLSDSLKTSFLSGEKKNAKITLNNNDNTDFLITDSDIEANSFKIDRYCSLSGAVVLGSAVAAELTFSLNNSDGKFDDFIFEGSDLKVEIGVNDSYIPCGHFTVDEIPVIGKKIGLKALDYMVKFDRPVDFSIFNSKPSMWALLRLCCSKCGVALNESGLSTLPNIGECVMTPPKSTNITYRQIIQWVAQITGTCAYVDYNGELSLSWFKSTNIILDSSNRYICGNLSEKPITVTGIKIKTSSAEFLSGSDDYGLLIENNELIVAGTEQTITDNIFDAIGGFTYRPFSCNAFSMPYMWPLDSITYKTATGDAISTVITNHNHSINGVSAVSALGETAQRKGYAVYGYKDGSDGVGVADVKTEYQISSTADTEPETWLETAPVVTEASPYLWAREIVSYTDGTSKPTSARVISIFTKDGNEGRGIKGVENWYLASNLSSGVTNQTDDFQKDSVPAISAEKKYLWNYEVMVYTDGTRGTPTEATIIGVFGEDGAPGSPGTDGKGILSISERYYATVSNSAPLKTWSNWKDTVSSANFSATNRYLWNYEIITYTTKDTNGNNEKTETDVRLIGVWGEKGADGDDVEMKTELSAVEKAQKELNNTLAASIGLHVTEKTVGNSVVRYFHTNPTLENSTSNDTILVFNSSGFGVCKSGWNSGNPQFTYGTTFDGKAVWDILTANTISADMINAGVIKSVNGATMKTEYNLNDGTLFFSNGETRLEMQAGSDTSGTPAGMCAKTETGDNLFFFTPTSVYYITLEYAAALLKYGLGIGAKPVDPFYSMVEKQQIKTDTLHCKHIVIYDENGENGTDLMTALTLAFDEISTRLDSLDTSVANLSARILELEEKLGETHEHAYTSQVTQSPSCTATGIRTYTCACGDSYTESISATGHSYTVVVQTIAPTATTQGYDLHTCSKCGNSYKDNYTDATGTDIESIYVGTPKAITIPESGYVTLKFTPTGSGEYTFESSNRVNDPKAWLYSDVALTNQLAYDDDSGADSRNFKFTASLTANVTYYLKVSCFQDLNGSCDITVTKETSSSSVQHEAEDKIVDGVLYVGTNKTSISYEAYKDRTDLTSVIIPSNITSIGGSAFFGCSNVTNITLPDSVTSIGVAAFRGCSITSIVLPQNLTEISAQMLCQCSNLTTVRLYNNITSISLQAFLGSNNLRDIYYNGTQTQWDAINIDSTNDSVLANVTIHYSS